MLFCVFFLFLLILLFCVASSTNIRMIAVGTQQGIWMGIEGDTNTINLVLSISDVTQIAVLEEHHILLVLSGMKPQSC